MPSFAHDLQAEVRKCIGLCASQKLQNLFSSGDVASQCNHNLSQPLARPHSKSRERQPKSYDQTWSSNMSNKYKPLHASGCNIFTYLNATSTANRLYRHLKSHLIILSFPCAPLLWVPRKMVTLDRVSGRIVSQPHLRRAQRVLPASKGLTSRRRCGCNQ